jgi:hypothetical protein
LVRKKKSTRLVLQPGHGKSGALGDTVLHVTDGSSAHLDAPSHAFNAACGHRIAGPIDQPAGTWTAVSPRCADGAEVIGESVGRAAAVLPHIDGDIASWQFQVWIDLLDPRVVPGFDLALKDVDVHVPGKLQIAT